MANAVVMKVMMIMKRCPEYDTYEGNAETTNVALHTCDYVPPNDYPRCMKSMPPSLISHMLFCDYPGVSSIYSTSPSSPSSSPPTCWGYVICEQPICRRHHHPNLQIFHINLGYQIPMVLDLTITWCCSCDRGGCGTNACSGIPGQYCRFQTHHHSGISGGIYIELHLMDCIKKGIVL